MADGIIGCSVTQRIKQIKQPRGGYVNPKNFDIKVLDGGTMDELHPVENVAPSLVGTAVDYMARFLTGADVEDAFRISFLGARNVDQEDLYETLLSHVTGLDDDSITAALRLVGFDVAFRADPWLYQPVMGIVPDAETIENVRTMINRSLRFFELYGPVVLSGLEFPGGYTDTVICGDGDFMTKDTLWDFKVSKQKLTSKQTLQLCMYWRMGLRSVHKEYQSVKYLGVFNPRMNVVYRLDVGSISGDILHSVDTDVIGY